MFGFTQATALMLLRPLIVDIIGDMITAGTVSAFLDKARIELIDQVRAIVGKNHFSWDDALAEALIEHDLEGGVLDDLSLKMMSLIEIWVKSSESKWDDDLVLPAIEQFKLAVEAK
jgi:hypothetical protein